MGALFALEWRYAAHNIAAIARSPFRAVLWAVYLVVVFGGIVARFVFRQRVHMAGFRHAGSLASYAAPVAGMLVLVIGITIVTAALGRVTTFRTRAEAVLFSNGGVKPLGVALWLQGRRVFSIFGRRLSTLALYYVIFVPAQAGTPAQTVTTLGGVLAGLAVLLSIELPVYLLSRRGLGPLLICSGVAVAAYGGAYTSAEILVSVSGLPLANEFLRRTPLDLGGFGRGIVAGNVADLLAMIVVVLLAMGAMLWLGGDAVPELYQAAERGLELRERLRSRRASVTRFNEAARSSRFVPAGAAAIVWKDWLAAKRARGAIQSWAIVTAVTLAFGAGCAFVAQGAGSALGIAPLLGPALIFLMIAPAGTARGLALDFGQPLWWLGTSSLRARLHALVFARAWRGAIVLTLGAVLCALLLDDVDIALVAPVAAFALWWSLGALGAALYTLFPYDVDRRGPMVLVRTVLVLVYFVPVGLVALLLGVAGLPLYAIAGAAALLLGIEGMAAVEIAALSVVENGAQLAAGERVS